MCTTLETQEEDAWGCIEDLPPASLPVCVFLDTVQLLVDVVGCFVIVTKIVWREREQGWESARADHLLPTCLFTSLY